LLPLRRTGGRGSEQPTITSFAGDPVGRGATAEAALTVKMFKEAIEDVFIAAWRLGLNSVAVQDGSKLVQPLTADEG
jgi:hypothetical protein